MEQYNQALHDVLNYLRELRDMGYCDDTIQAVKNFIVERNLDVDTRP